MAAWKYLPCPFCGFTRHDTRAALVQYVTEAWNRRLSPEEHLAWAKAKRGIQALIYRSRKRWPHAGEKN